MLTGYEKLPHHLQKYVDYILNTKLEPLPVVYFDDDWSPVGPDVRQQLSRGGFITYGAGGKDPEGIYLRPDLADKKYD